MTPRDQRVFLSLNCFPVLAVNCQNDWICYCGHKIDKNKLVQVISKLRPVHRSVNCSETNLLKAVL